MAKRATIGKLLAKTSKKGNTKTRNELAVINYKYFGDEITFDKTKELSSLEILKAMNWYNYMEDVSSAKEYAEEYFTFINRPDLAKIIKKVSDNNMINSIGWISRLLSNGYILPETYKNELISKTEKLIIDTPVIVSTIQKPKSISSSYLIKFDEFIDEVLFNNKLENFYAWCLSNEFNKTQVSEFKIKLTELYEYYKLVFSSKDSQFIEGYKHIQKKNRESLLKYFNDCIFECDRLVNNASASRKPRAPNKKKPISLEKKLKSFRFQSEFNELNLKSINPSNVIGCGEVWIYNTLKKQISVLRAETNKTIDIQRISFINVDENNSFTKNVGKTPKETLAAISSGTKAFAKRTFDEIKRVQLKANHKSNENMIILRIFK